MTLRSILNKTKKEADELAAKVSPFNIGITSNNNKKSTKEKKSRKKPNKQNETSSTAQLNFSNDTEVAAYIRDAKERSGNPIHNDNGRKRTKLPPSTFKNFGSALSKLGVRPVSSPGAKTTWEIGNDLFVLSPGQIGVCKQGVVIDYARDLHTSEIKYVLYDNNNSKFLGLFLEKDVHGSLPDGHTMERVEKDKVMMDGMSLIVGKPPHGNRGGDEEEKEEEMKYGKDTRVVTHDGGKEGTVARVSGGKYYIKYDDGEEDGNSYDEDDLIDEFEVGNPVSNETDDVSITSSVKNNQTLEDDDNDDGNSDDGITLQDELNELDDKENGGEGRKGGHSAETVGAKGVSDKSVTEDNNVEEETKAAEGGKTRDAIPRHTLEKQQAAAQAAAAVASGNKEQEANEKENVDPTKSKTFLWMDVPTFSLGGGKKRKKQSKSGSPKMGNDNETGIFKYIEEGRTNTRAYKSVNSIIKKIGTEKKKVVASIMQFDEVKKKMDAPGVDVEVKTLFLKYHLQMVNNNDSTMPEHLRKNVYEPWEEACKEALDEMKLVKYDGEELDWNKLSVNEVRKLGRLFTL